MAVTTSELFFFVVLWCVSVLSPGLYVEPLLVEDDAAASLFEINCVFCHLLGSKSFLPSSVCMLSLHCSPRALFLSFCLHVLLLFFGVISLIALLYICIIYLFLLL